MTAHLAPGSQVARASTAATRISERHRHRYEVNINYKDRLEAGGLALLRHVARRHPARDRRDARPSLVHRRAVPSRAEVEALRPAPAVHLLHRARRSTSRGWCEPVCGMLRRSCEANPRCPSCPARVESRVAAALDSRRSPHSRATTSAMNEPWTLTMTQPRHVTIGNVTIGNDRPLALIAGPCALESRAHALEMCQALVEMTAQARHRPHLQDLVRQGQPHLASTARAAWAWRRACRSWPSCASASAARC